jgi:hypothetical protein
MSELHLPSFTTVSTSLVDETQKLSLIVINKPQKCRVLFSQLLKHGLSLFIKTAY